MNPSENFETPHGGPQQPFVNSAPQEGEPDEPRESHPLRPLVKAWLTKIRAGMDFKKQAFDGPAAEVMMFFHGGNELNDWLWGMRGAGRGGFMASRSASDLDKLAPPGHRFQMNKVAEVEQLFTPALYLNNPNRKVNPREHAKVDPAIYQILAGPPPQVNPMVAQIAAQNPQLSMMLAQQQQAYAQGVEMRIQQGQQSEETQKVIQNLRAELMEEYLNWTPNELDLKGNSRRVNQEALLKGMGVFWTELYVQKGFGTTMVGSFYDTEKNLVLDPDPQLVQDCTWACRIRHTPQWDLEDIWGLKRGALDGAAETRDSVEIASELGTDSDELHNRRRGTTNKIVTSYEVWSKMGMGGRMTGIDKHLRDTFDGFGDYCHLVLVDGCPYPLNLPSKLVNSAKQATAPEESRKWSEAIRQAVEWPIPVWAFADGWPFTLQVFREVPNSLYPMSHFSPGMGELKWINWAMSWLASKVRSACGTIVAVAKSVDPNEKEKLISVGDQRVIEVELEMGGNGAMDVSKMIAYVQQPEFHPAIFEMVDRTQQILDKRWGVSPQLYGMSAGETQDRSATETQIKQSNLSIRLKDMADRVKETQALIARKEAILSRWFLQAQDVAPAMGQERAKLWEQFVQSADIEQVVLELDYTVDAGSMQILDRMTQLQNHQSLMQTTMPFLEKIAMSWNEVGPWNAMMKEYGRLQGVDVSDFLIKPPPPTPPPPPPEAPQGPPQGGPPQPQGPGPMPIAPAPQVTAHQGGSGMPTGPLPHAPHPMPR